MTDEKKTKDRLKNELAEMRQRVAELEEWATERARPEQQLPDARDYLDRVVSGMHEGLMVISPECEILDANSSFLEQYGVTREEIIGRTCHEVTHRSSKPCHQAGHPCPLKSVLETAAPVRAEHVHTDREGKEYLVELHAFPLLGEAGQVESVVEISQDITERERTEEALQRQKDLNESIIRNMGEGLLLTDERGYVTFTNPTTDALLGYEPEELIGQHWTLVVPPDQQGAVEAADERRVRGKTDRYEVELLHKDGTRIHVLVSGSPRFEDDRFTGSLAVFTDITERKRAEDALRQSEERHRGLFENSPIALWEQDCHEVKEYTENLRASGIRDFVEYFENHPETVRDCARLVRVTDVNQAALDLYEADSKGELLGNLDQVFTEESYDVFRKELLAISGGRTTFHAETSARTLNGERKDIALRWAVMPGCEATYSRVLVSDTDITERKSAEEALDESVLDLGERVKELNCLYGISNLVEKPGISLEDILQGVVDLIPPAWQYPEITCARLTLKDQQFETARFEESVWTQSGRIVVRGQQVGTLEVCCLEERPESDEGPFLRQERVLINAVVERLGRIIGREWADDALRRALEETARGQRLLVALSQGAQEVQRARTAEEIYTTVGDQMVELGYHAGILTLTDDRQHLEVSYLTFELGAMKTAEALTGLSAKDVRLNVVPGGVYDRVITEGKATFMERPVELVAEILPGFARPLASWVAEIFGLKENISAPLTVGSETVGVLYVVGEGLTEADTPAVSAFANQAAIALQNARLYQSLADSEEELRHQIESAADAIFNLDVDGRFTLFNREAERLSGHQRQDVLGQPYTQLVCPDYLEEVGEMLSPNATPEGLQQVREIEIFDKWGDRIPLEMRASMLETDGQLVGWQVIARDISKRKHLEELKGQFIATVSHDLRTPLASIMGFAEMLMEGSPGPLTEVQEEFLGIIFENSQRQLALVNDLLDISKLEAGRLQLEMEEVHLPELIWGMVEQIRPLAEKKRIALTMKVNKELPRTEGDPRRLERVLNNLLSNAVKFTPEGGSVEVTAWQDDGHLKVRVSDTGVGIPAEDLSDLFQPFHRGRNVTKQAIEGTGLGLTIVKALVEAHRGTIEVESELGKGTTVELTLPLREPATK